MATGLTLVADSSAWIALYREQASLTKEQMRIAITEHRVLVPDLVLVEVLRGIDAEHTAKAVAKEFNHFEIITVGGKALAHKAAENYRSLRNAGLTIRGTVDLLIATWCIENKIPLIHVDRDFSGFEQHLGLQVWRGE
jgi:predicted nucleic acid-binding protein